VLLQAPLPDAFLSSVRRISPFAVGLRSATASSADLLPLVKDLATACPDCYLCCFPSASTPAMPGTEVSMCVEALWAMRDWPALSSNPCVLSALD